MRTAHSSDFILSFGFPLRDSLSQTWNRVLAGLSQRQTVLHVLPHFYVREDGLRLNERISRSGIRVVGENLFEYQPPWFLPGNYRFPAINDAVQDIGTRLVGKLARKLGCRRPILYIWHPTFARMVGKFGESVVCYHVYDDFYGYKGGSPEDRKLIRELDESVLARADVVFAASRKLFSDLLKKHSNVHLVPNGVDFGLFASAASDVRIPLDLQAVRGPRIGYVGNINIKVDLQLLADIAVARPDWSIVLIGPVNAPGKGMERCMRLQNVHFLGPKHYQHTPQYVAGLDVCIMPYVLDGWVLSGYPLKMHEYLAAGKPVVSSDLDSVREFERVVRIAHSLEGWIEHIECELASYPSGQGAIRQRVAQQNSWQQRVMCIEKAIKECVTVGDEAKRSATTPVEAGEVASGGRRNCAVTEFLDGWWLFA